MCAAHSTDSYDFRMCPANWTNLWYMRTSRVFVRPWRLFLRPVDHSCSNPHWQTMFLIRTVWRKDLALECFQRTATIVPHADLSCIFLTDPALDGPSPEHSWDNPVWWLLTATPFKKAGHSKYAINLKHILLRCGRIAAQVYTLHYSIQLPHDIVEQEIGQGDSSPPWCQTKLDILDGKPHAVRYTSISWPENTDPINLLVMSIGRLAALQRAIPLMLLFAIQDQTHLHEV